jgi:hypothetical protein
MTIPELIEILKAGQQGKTIEWYSSECGWSEFRGEDKVSFIVIALSLGRPIRIQPEPPPKPREWVVVLGQTHHPEISGFATFFKSEADAKKCYGDFYESIRVREVLPE